MTRKKIMIVADDHPVVREALARIVAGLHPHVTLYSGPDSGELMKLVERRQRPDGELTFVDVVVPDAAAPRQDGRPDAPLMMVTAEETGITARWFVSLETDRCPDETRSRIEAALSQRDAVHALIAELKDAARHEGRDVPIPQGGLPSLDSLIALGLTQRQAEVLLFLAEGLSNKEIARKISVSEWTVRHHVSAILERLEVSNRMRAANIARTLGQA